MLRKRLFLAVAAVGLGSLSGCFSMSQHPFFARLRACFGRPECCEVAAPACEGPCLDGPMLPGGGPAPFAAPPITQQPTMPQLAPAPRLVPTPQGQAPNQPAPAGPNAP
jgi:hypothetical protein